jgi:hypothetical protein
MKTHNLETIEDICRLVTEDNFVALMTDLAEVFNLHARMKKVFTEEDYSNLKDFTVEWKDDGISGMTHVIINGVKMPLTTKK